MKRDDIIVVGAGIVGISTALALQAKGYTVRVLDRKGVAAEASQGNAGAFAFTDIIPLATPGIMRKAPKWMLDPMGPLSVPAGYALKIAPWMLRFWRASWPDRYAAAIAAQTSLMGFSREALERQIVAVEGQDLIRREGQLQLYEGEKEFQASLPDWEVRRKHGVEYTCLDGAAAIAELQPGLHSRFTHGVFTPGWMSTTDPKVWTEHLAKVFCNRGGVIDTADVQKMEQQGDLVSLHTLDGPIIAQQVVVACGAWSHHLARTVGDHLPLETERGYNTTLPNGGFDLRTQLTFGGHGFVITKIGDGLRVGGAVELGGLKLPPNYKRSEHLLQKAARFIPELNTKGGTQWMGFRPSMPDSLPVIGRSPRAKGVLYAFGHGHLGLTQSAGTAELIAALADAASPDISIEAYAPTRF
ncbi:NAD(P)/FAD-dependent oxidoreductase [Parasedimentitalea maritima]|uniref:FAD-dependent oxidoreductase n=1 Tax=Parasedimentitalea maritima TaxID=2578117 RepID=A0A6A4RIN2_9RHOB|nr:FAD-dependent oxidoreductase [Zongyanglinia marina]KAE9631012.1 FAD-dependent oxidoreductase [Zongyanglinia marina]